MLYVAQGYKSYFGGMVAFVAGCALIAGASRDMMAAPAPPISPNDCPNQTISQAVNACLTSATVCNGQATQLACEDNQKKHVENFPALCSTTQAGMMCNNPLANCYKNTNCKFLPGVDNAPDACVEEPIADAVWTSAAKPTGASCPN